MTTGSTGKAGVNGAPFPGASGSAPGLSDPDGAEDFLGPDVAREQATTIDVTDRGVPELAALALPALAKRPVYQRGGRLVHVASEPERDSSGVVHAKGPLRIRELPRQLLENELSQAARWVKAEYQKDGTPVEADTDPPQKVVTTILESGQWAHIEPLRGIAQWPVLSPAGFMVVRNGYSPATRFVLTRVPRVKVLERPTRDDAKQAAATLLDLVAEFPFAEEAGRAAWLSGILTLIARPMIDGPIPAIIFDAPTPGAGKTLLAHLISMIVTGEPATARAAPQDNAEWNRALLSIARSGDPIVLFDNLRGRLENGSLEAILTSNRFADRVLRTNEDLKVDVQTQFLITGNNCTITRDFVRRALHCRLVPGTERPELRGGFKIQDVQAHARRHRTRLLSAVLTIFWAYARAGYPPVELRHLGTYERWSSVVRQPLIWAGCADPATTQDALLEACVSESGDASAVLDAWHAHYGARELTAREALEGIGDAPNETALQLRTAILGWFAEEKITPALFAAKLKPLRDAILGRCRLESPGRGKAGARWRVVLIDG